MKVSDHTPSFDSPVTWSEDFCAGAWVITRYQDVAAALRDPRFSVRRAARWVNSTVKSTDPKLDQFKRIFARSVLFLEGRAHRRMRSLILSEFKASHLQAQASAIANITHSLIEALPQKATNNDGEHTTFDFVTDFARPLPAMVIANLMGISTRQPPEFTDWSADLAAFIGAPTPNAQQVWRAQKALSGLADFFLDEMHSRTDTPEHHGILGHIMLARQQNRLSQVEAVAQCCTLLFAGYETTRNLLSNGVLALLRHPDQWAQLKNSPELLRPAIREMLRYDSPVQYTGRRLLADIELHGKKLRKGQLAILHIGAANRDPNRFSAPHQFNITRDEGNNLAFGNGPHVCIGAALSAMEAEIAFGALLQALPNLSLASAPPVWQNNPAYRALEQLPLTYA